MNAPAAVVVGKDQENGDSPNAVKCWYMNTAWRTSKFIRRELLDCVRASGASNCGLIGCSHNGLSLEGVLPWRIGTANRCDARAGDLGGRSLPSNSRNGVRQDLATSDRTRFSHNHREAFQAPESKC